MQTAVGILPGVDIRADGGFVVLPPTVHPSGKRYAWELEPGAVEFAPYPASKLGGSARTRREPLQIVAKIRDGAQNDTLTRLAGHLRRPGTSEEAIRAALLVENRARCVPPLPDEEVIRIARSVSRYAPAKVAEVASRQEGESPGGEADQSVGDEDEETFRLIPLDWEQLVREGLP